MIPIHGVPFESHLGIVVQKDGDSGDSAQRTATLVVVLSLLGEGFGYVYDRMILFLKVSKGRYRRSSIPGHWGNDPTNFSRDQHSILMLAMAVAGDREELKESFLEILKRGGFHQNFMRGTDDFNRFWKLPDFISPTEISVFIRGMNFRFLKPALFLLDLGLLVDLRLRLRQPWDYDNMFAQNLFYANKVMPTPIARLALSKYAKTDFRERILEYHSTEGSSNGVDGLGELYIRAAGKVIEDTLNNAT